MRIKLQLFLLLCVAGLVAGCVEQAREAGATLTTPEGVAIQGYDTVAYFTEGVATPGSPEFAVQYNDAAWWFATAEHQDLFKDNPEAYAPAYGGWCAYGMAEGYAAETDPVNGWTIHEGRLYLNWDARIAKEWNGDRGGFLQKSESNWPEVNRELTDGSATVYWH